jgi:hypothetical protein
METQQTYAGASFWDSYFTGTAVRGEDLLLLHLNSLEDMP